MWKFHKETIREDISLLCVLKSSLSYEHVHVCITVQQKAKPVTCCKLIMGHTLYSTCMYKTCQELHREITFVTA